MRENLSEALEFVTVIPTMLCVGVSEKGHEVRRLDVFHRDRVRSTCIFELSQKADSLTFYDPHKSGSRCGRHALRLFLFYYIYFFNKRTKNAKLWFSSPLRVYTGPNTEHVGQKPH